MYGITMELSDEALSEDFLIPIGKAKIEREGDYFSIIIDSKNTLTINHLRTWMLQ